MPTEEEPLKSRRPNLKVDLSPSFLTPTNSAPGTPTRGRSPIRPDSPLLCGTPPMSPIAKRAKELNKELRRARSFRSSRESSRTRVRTDSESKSHSALKKGAEVCFSIRPSLGARKGWKIMPEDGENEETDPEILSRVVKMIKEMELNGHTIPERITIKN